MSLVGTFRLAPGHTIYLNTETEEGIPELLEKLRPSIKYLAYPLDFPGYTKEDIEQEMYRLAFEALPRYNPEKPANLITFLVSHIKNRTINLCKFFAEKRRVASFVNNPIVKVRCNACRTFFKGKADSKYFRCSGCGVHAAAGSDAWNIYNVAIVPHSVEEVSSRNEIEVIEITPDNSGFTAIGTSLSLDEIDFRSELSRLIAEEADIDKSIINLICQGYTRGEIAKTLGMPTKSISSHTEAIFARIRQRLEAQNDTASRKSSGAECESAV
jgi:DNA-directed RNA polymerase specialized sigma24 family protein